MSHDHRRRTVEAPGLRAREADADAGEPRALAGHAAVFNEWYTLHRTTDVLIREVIRPGAFLNAIAEGQDVRCLIDHNPTLILGRTRAGTLSLSEDARGLLFTCSLPDTQAARDIAENIHVANVSQCSFAFLPRDGGETITTRTEGGVTIQEVEVTDVDLYDVSVVTYPAYESTDVAARSKVLRSRIQTRWLADRRAKLALLESASK